jgi:hypothetical protein
MDVVQIGLGSPSKHRLPLLGPWCTMSRALARHYHVPPCSEHLLTGKSCNNMYWLVLWNIFIFPYIGNNSPNCLIFFRRVETTNQNNMFDQSPRRNIYICLSIVMLIAKMWGICTYCRGIEHFIFVV